MSQLDRVVYVERRIRQRGWSLQVARDIAKEMNCDVRTVYRYKKRIQRWTAATMGAADVDSWRAQQVQELMDVARLARKKEDYNTAVRAIEVQAKIIGTIAPVKADVRVSGAVAHVPVTTDTMALLTELHQLAEQRASAIEATAERVGEVVPATPRDGDEP